MDFVAIHEGLADEENGGGEEEELRGAAAEAG